MLYVVIEIKIINFIKHRIPRESSRRRAWLQALGLQGWEPPVRTYICSIHFCLEDYDKSSNARFKLLNIAVPSVSILFPVIKVLELRRVIF